MALDSIKGPFEGRSHKFRVRTEFFVHLYSSAKVWARVERVWLNLDCGFSKGV